MEDVLVPVIDEAKLNAFGIRLFNLFETHKSDRKAVEEHWLRNLRQFRGIYDPEILSMIPSDCSKAYPKLTRWKVIGTVARLMQMLFPQTERNYGIKPSPMPDLSVEQLQEVLNALVAAEASEQQVDPRDVVLEDEDIERAVLEYAKGKAARMELKVRDDLDEMEFITLARKVVFSAALYNVGVLEGPLHLKKKSRTWERDANRGGYKAVEVEKRRPVFEFLRVWDWFPDLTANSLDKQDGTFVRRVMTREQVQELADRPDFLGARVLDWLNKNRSGNHTPLWWETVLQNERKSDHTPVQDKAGRKYEVLFYEGAVTGHELRAANVPVKDEDVGRTFQASCAVIDKTVIKARLAPLSDTRRFHTFVFEDDDLNLLGNGLCDTLRDSQLSLCEVTRAALDNASVIGPMAEMNMDLLTPGQDTSLRKNKTFFREGEGAIAGYPAVRNITIDSHLPDLQSMMNVFLEFADKESGLPPPSVGDVSGGGSEALRTTQNASMFLGAAALPIRDTVRNYDTFTISVISALVKWNMKYDPNPSRDGDHDVIARGSTSLIAKEVLGQALALFKQTLAPEDWPYVKRRVFLLEQAKAQDLPEDLLEDEETAQATIDRQQQVQAKQMEDQAALVHAQVEEMLSRAFAHAAKARGDDASINIDVFQAIMDGLREDGEQAVRAATAAGKLQPKPAVKTGGGA